MTTNQTYGGWFFVVIYIVDFGLSQVLRDHTKNVYLYNENSIVCPSGTPRYMSVRDI